MAVREQTVQDLADKVAERWSKKEPYDKTSFRTMISDAIKGRGITNQLDRNELMRRVSAECSKRSASHRGSVAKARKSA